MHKKIIYQGRLAFGTQRSYDKIKKLCEHRVENFYRNDVLIDPEEVFNDDTFSLEIGRQVINAMEKSWRNTLALLEYCGQFAVEGKIGAWLIDEGRLKKTVEITPDSEKMVVIHYRKGLELMQTKGKEQEAIESLDLAINKYDKHATAYEKRGYINMKLKKYVDAARDFNKCLKLDDAIPEAYYGLAKINLLNKQHAEAVKNLEMVTKKAIALQPIYWQARRQKAESHVVLKEYDKAVFDLKFLSKRVFAATDPNFDWKRYDYFIYGKVLIETGDFAEAFIALDQALKLPEVKGRGRAPEADILFFKSIARKETGKKDFIKDLKESASMGHKKAIKMLEDSRKRKKRTTKK